MGKISVAGFKNPGLLLSRLKTEVLCLYCEKVDHKFERCLKHGILQKLQMAEFVSWVGVTAKYSGKNTALEHLCISVGNSDLCTTAEGGISICNLLPFSGIGTGTSTLYQNTA